MVRVRFLFCASVLAALAIGAPAPASAQCLLCPTSPQPGADARPPVPLSVEVDAGLDFPRIATGPGGGAVVVSPGAPARVSGGVANLGGLSMHGSVVIRGEPGRAVRIELPERVTLRATTGETADLEDLRSDLPAGPRLGPDGVLRFEFGGRLLVRSGGTGDFRGRIPITVDYL